MEVGRRGWWPVSAVPLHEVGRGGREGVGKGRDKSNCLAVASRSNHWNLSELPPNEGWAYCVFAPIYLIVALTMMEFVP